MESYRPHYHFTPEKNWMNDPNGVVYFDGEYHLFYQYNPYGNDWGHMHWGHAVSPDMVHWEHLPVALHEHDDTMIFSGSAVVDEANTSGLCEGDEPCIVAIYTGHTVNPESHSVNQSQNIAYSRDRGRTWSHYSGNPVIDLNKRNFRDPNVIWYEPTGQWIQVVALSDEHRVRIYGSPDLKRWSHLSDFGPAGAVDGIWECPELLELPVDGDPNDKRWVLKVDLNPGHPAGGSGAQYFVGGFDGQEFVDEQPDDAPLLLDYGRDFYSAFSWYGAPAINDSLSPPWVAWMNNWAYAAKLPTHPWRGAMTIPRNVSLRSFDEGVRLVQSPIPELQSIRGLYRHYAGNDLASISTQILEDSISGDAIEIIAAISPGSARLAGIRVRVGPEEETVVGYDARTQEMFVDRTRSGNTSFDDSFAGRHAGPLPLRQSSVRLHIFVDSSSVEVFGNDGQTVITDLIFPDPSSTGIEVFCEGGDIDQIILDIWELSKV